MSFLLASHVQFVDETEMVDIYIGSRLADVYARLVASSNLDLNQCIIQIFEPKIFSQTFKNFFFNKYKFWLFSEYIKKVAS